METKQPKEVTLTPIDVNLNFIDVTLETIPIKLNSLFDGLTLTSFKDLEGVI